MSKSKSSAATALVPIAPASASRVVRAKSKPDASPLVPRGGDEARTDGLEFEDEREPAVVSSPAAVEGEVDLDEEFDLGDAVAADLDVEPVKPASQKRADEGGGDSMLSRYFREMATHHVMGPQEELATAIEVEQG